MTPNEIIKLQNKINRLNKALNNEKFIKNNIKLIPTLIYELRKSKILLYEYNDIISEKRKRYYQNNKERINNLRKYKNSWCNNDNNLLKIDINLFL